MTQTAMVDAVRRLVCVESPTEDVAACGRAVHEAIAICADWLPGAAHRFEHGDRPVFGWGTERPRILLLGHLDTVWPLGTINRLPWSDDDGRLRGPGVFDMKAGVVQAIAALREAGIGPDDGVGLLLTTDEETGSATSRDLIASAASRAEAVLVFEPSLDGRLKTRRKGTSWYVVDIAGRAAHAGLDPQRGINALIEASRLALATTSWGIGETTVTPTLMRAGTTANTVAAEASLTIDVRAWTADEQERVDALVRGWQPDAGARSIRGGIDRPALEHAMSADLFARAAEIAERLGMAPLGEAAVGGASDGNLTAALGHPTLDGLGAVGDGAHADHEWVSAADLEPRARLVAGLIRDLLDGRDG